MCLFWEREDFGKRNSSLPKISTFSKTSTPFLAENVLIMSEHSNSFMFLLHHCKYKLSQEWGLSQDHFKHLWRYVSKFAWVIYLTVYLRISTYCYWHKEHESEHVEHRYPVLSNIWGSDQVLWKLENWKFSRRFIWELKGSDTKNTSKSNSTYSRTFLIWKLFY